MGAIKEYLTFVSKLEGRTRSGMSLVKDYRFIAGVLLFLSGRNSRLPSLIKGLTILAARLFFGIETTRQCYFESIIYLPHPRNIINGAKYFGRNVILYHNTTLGAKRLDFNNLPENRPGIGSSVVIATGAVILGGGIVVDGSVVSANQVLITDK